MGATMPRYAQIIDPHAALMRCDLFAIERALVEIRERLAGPPGEIVPCKGCEGTGRTAKRTTVFDPVLCAGCQGAGVQRV